MKNRVIAEITAYGKRIQLIAHENGEEGYSVFTRVLSNWDQDDVDCYNRKDSAMARFLFLANTLLLETHLPF